MYIMRQRGQAAAAGRGLYIPSVPPGTPSKERCLQSVRRRSFHDLPYTRPVRMPVFPGQSSCQGCSHRKCAVFPERPPFSVSGHRRYNTLDLASKIVCHGNAVPIGCPCQRGSPFGFPTASGRRQTVSHTLFPLPASRQRGAHPLFEISPLSCAASNRSCSASLKEGSASLEIPPPGAAAPWNPKKQEMPRQADFLSKSLTGAFQLPQH